MNLSVGGLCRFVKESYVHSTRQNSNWKLSIYIPPVYLNPTLKQTDDKDKTTGQLQPAEQSMPTHPIDRLETLSSRHALKIKKDL